MVPVCHAKAVRASPLIPHFLLDATTYINILAIGSSCARLISRRSIQIFRKYVSRRHGLVVARFVRSPLEEDHVSKH